MFFVDINVQLTESTHIFLGLVAPDGDEDGLEGPLQEAVLGAVAHHAVGLARPSHAVREQQAVLAVEHVLDERLGHVLVQLPLSGRLVKHLSERVDQLEPNHKLLNINP